jgi:hypothetical protein
VLHPLELDQQAPILHYIYPGLGQPLSRLVVPDPQLHPHRPRRRSLGQDVVDVRRHILRSTEYVDNVDGTGDIGDSAIDRLTENLRDLGEIHRDGNDLEPRVLRVFRHVVRRRSGFGRLDAEDGHPVRDAEERGDFFRCLEQAAGRGRGSLGMMRATAREWSHTVI